MGCQCGQWSWLKPCGQTVSLSIGVNRSNVGRLGLSTGVNAIIVDRLSLSLLKLIEALWTDNHSLHWNWQKHCGQTVSLSTGVVRSIEGRRSVSTRVGSGLSLSTGFSRSIVDILLVSPLEDDSRVSPLKLTETLWTDCLSLHWSWQKHCVKVRLSMCWFSG